MLRKRLLRGDRSLVAAVCIALSFLVTGSVYGQLTVTEVATLTEGGSSFAIDGNRAIVGATIFEDSAGGWIEVAKLASSGQSVAISGDYAIVGGWGSAAIYERQAGTWTLVWTGEQGEDDGFGAAVAISGSTAAVGAPYGYEYEWAHFPYDYFDEFCDQEGCCEDWDCPAYVGAEFEMPGYVYRITRMEGGWTEQGALKDPSVEPEDQWCGDFSDWCDTWAEALNDDTGRDVAVSGDTFIYLAARRTGTALVSSSGGPLQRLAPSLGGSFNNVDIDGDLAVASTASKAYIFEYDTEWTEVARLSEPALAVGGRRILTVSGAIYESVSGVWTEVGRLPIDPVNADLDNSNQVIANREGTVYVYRLSTAVNDVTPPTCDLLAIDPGPPVDIDVLIHDPESGVETIRFIKVKNASVEVPEGSGNFYNAGDVLTLAPPETEPFMLDGVKLDASRGSTVIIKVTDDAGNTVTCDPVALTVSAEIPTEYTLSTNYPNPFNPTTSIEFAIPEDSHVRLAVFDMIGREVALLRDELTPAGTYTVTWDATDARGRVLPSGIYFYRIEAGAFAMTKAMSLLK